MMGYCTRPMEFVDRERDLGDLGDLGGFWGTAWRCEW